MFPKNLKHKRSSPAQTLQTYGRVSEKRNAQEQVKQILPVKCSQQLKILISTQIAYYSKLLSALTQRQEDLQNTGWSLCAFSYRSLQGSWVKHPLITADIQVGQIHTFFKQWSFLGVYFVQIHATRFSLSSLSCAPPTHRQLSCAPTMCCSALCVNISFHS